MRQLPLLAILLLGQAQAQPRADVCLLAKTQTPTTGVSTTFVVMGGYHGSFATSISCPRARMGVDFSHLGNGKMDRAFHHWFYSMPKLKSGATEVKATIDFSGSELVVRKVHSYRELSEAEAKPFFPPLTPSDEAKSRAAAKEAAKDADFAAHR